MKKNLVNILESWSILNSNIHELTEEQCLEILEHEKATERRFSFLVRIYGRYSKLRHRRERAELMEISK